MVNRIKRLAGFGRKYSRGDRSLRVSRRRRIQSRTLAVTLSAFLTGGCMGLDPVSYTAVKMSIDGISYLSTGKSTTDHAVSAVTGYDCNMLNIFSRERAVCEGWQPDDLADAANEIDAGRHGAVGFREAFTGSVQERAYNSDPAALADVPLQMPRPFRKGGSQTVSAPYFSLWAPQP